MATTPMCPGCKVTIPLAAVISAALMKYGYDVGSKVVMLTPIITATVFYGYFAVNWYYQGSKDQNVSQPVIKTANPADDCSYIEYVFNNVVKSGEFLKSYVCDVNPIDNIDDTVTTNTYMEHHHHHCAGH